MSLLSRLARVCVTVLTVGLTASACGGDDPGDAARVDQLIADADAARQGVVRDLAEAIDAGFVSSTRRHSFCGESYAPQGLELNDHLLFEPSPLGLDDAMDTVVRVLEEQGWAVERLPRPTIVLGTKGDIEIRAEAGPAAFQVDVSNPECIETSDDVAREFAERTERDIGGVE